MRLLTENSHSIALLRSKGSSDVHNCRMLPLESGLQKTVKRAAAQAGIDKKVGCQTLRHSFATHMLENGVNIRVLQ
jgi:site-specific recombinase XerD